LSIEVVDDGVKITQFCRRGSVRDQSAGVDEFLRIEDGRKVVSIEEGHDGASVVPQQRRALGGHPKPASRGHLKTGQ
jgi:hypothetical protein